MTWLYTIVLSFVFLVPTQVRSQELPPPPTDLTVEQLITKDAALYKVDPILAHRIAWCESRLNPNAKNAESSASGVFQFLNGSWQAYGKRHWGIVSTRNVFSAADNVDLAMWLMGNYGTGDWAASQACWGKKIPPS